MPPTDLMMSPFSKPAASAGVPGDTSATSTPSRPTVQPTLRPDLSSGQAWLNLSPSLQDHSLAGVIDVDDEVPEEGVAESPRSCPR